jgi:hypothetical protein
MPKYKKAPKYLGNDLTVNLGRSDLKLEDNVEYDNPRLARFVSLGFVVEVKEKVAPAPVAVPAPVVSPPPKPVEKKKVPRYTESELAKSNKAALVDLASSMGVELERSLTKAEMIEAILEKQG